MNEFDMLFRQCKTIFFDNIIDATIIKVIPCQYTKDDFAELLVLRVDDDTTILRRFPEVQIDA